MEERGAIKRRDPAKLLKTNRALYSAIERYTALPAGVTCLKLADAAGIVLRLRTFLRLWIRTVTYFVTRMRPLNGNRTPLPSSQSMPSNVASMVLTVAFPVVTKSPVHPRGEV